MTFKKGQSGNPKGRPTKDRALTAILASAGDQKIETGDGRKVEAKKLLADMLWNAASTGKVKFSDGRSDVLSADDWFDIVTFLYRHIDGPAKTELDVTTGGEPISISVFGVISEDDNDQPISATG